MWLMWQVGILYFFATKVEKTVGKNWDFEQEKRLISMEYHGDRLGIQWNTCRLLWRLGRLGVCKLSLWKFRRRISCYEFFFWNGRWRNLSRIWVLNCELFPGQQDLEKMDGLLRQQFRGSATVSLKRTPFLTPRYHFQPCIIFGGMINHWFSLHLITYSTYKSL